MIKLLYFFVAALVAFLFRKIIITYWELNPDYLLDFFAIFSAGFLGKYIAGFIIDMFNTFSGQLFYGGNNISSVQNPSNTSGIPSNSTSSINNPSDNNLVNLSSVNGSMDNLANNTSNPPSPGNLPDAPSVSNPSSPGSMSVDNAPADNTSEMSTDTDWSGGVPASPNTLETYTDEIVNQVATLDPAHRINDPTDVTEGGYTGGGGLDFESISSHSDDSGLGGAGNTSVQPFASNLALYLENYRRDSNAVYGTFGFPRMDEASLRWYIGYLNSNFPDHYGAERLNPTSSRIIRALRNTP
jgi:hypothetical protein